MKAITIFNKNNTVRDPDLITQPLLHIYKFKNLLKKAHNVLFKASSVFPFDFFPDEITIDENKVNIIFHQFYLSEDIHSISINMIKDIEVESGPFFASLRIVPDGYPGKLVAVRYLKKQDAIKARRIIQGLMLINRHGIELSKINSVNKINEVEYLGGTHIANC